MLGSDHHMNTVKPSVTKADMEDVGQHVYYTYPADSKLNNFKKSGPVDRPLGELVNHAAVLELILRTQFNFPVESLRKYIAPHWEDVLGDKLSSSMGEIQKNS